MIRYFKNFEGEYIISISTGSGKEEISQEEYENILNLVRNRPEPEDGYDYKLKEDLTWELVEISSEKEVTEEI